MNTLPTEIYINIFQHLSRPQIEMCSFVCKQWNTAAVQVYSKVLIIDEEKTEIAKLDLESNNINHHFKNGHLARKLIFKCMYKYECKALSRYKRDLECNENTQKPCIRLPFTQKQFLLLLKYFPNIEEIDLTEIQIDMVHYMSFLMNSNLQHIKIITADIKNYNYYPDEFEIYFLTCFRYRDTLTHLYFDYSTDTRFNHYLNKMNQFKNLKELQFLSDYYDDLMLFRVLDLCPQLIDLTYDSGYARNRAGMVLEPLDQKFIAGLSKKLQHLKIRSPFLPVNFAKHLLNYIDDGLRTVDINITGTWFYDWIKNAGTEDALDLMKKLGQLNDVSISFSYDHSTPSTIISSELKLTKWFQFVKAFRGQKKTTCTVKFIESSRWQYSFKSSPSQLYFEYSSWTTDFFREPRENLIYGYDDHLLEPMNSISTIEPENIDRLEIFITKKKKDTEIWNILRDVFRLFRSTQYIKINSCLQVQVFTDREKNELNGIQNSLKIIYNFFIIPMDAVFDLFPAHLLNIEVLVFGVIQFGSSLDLTRFKNLKQCHFIIQQNDPPPFYFHFEYLDGKTKSYTYKQGEMMEGRDGGYYYKSFYFKCKRDTNFVIYSGLNTKILDFDFNEPPKSGIHIPTNIIL